MVKITINEILNLLDVAKERGLVKYGSNDVFKQNDWIENDFFGDYRYLYYCFDVYNEVPLDHKHIDTEYFRGKEYVCGKRYIVTVGAYYKCYLELFGTEPYNLAQELFDYIEIGGEYGWHGNPFNICTDKQLSENGTITVKLLYCNSNAGLPMFSEEYTECFKINPKNENLLEEIKRLDAIFEYPNQAHYPLTTTIIVNGKEETIAPLPDKAFDIITSTKMTIKRNKKALEILKKIKNKK